MADQGNQPPFSRRTAIGLAVFSVVSLLAGFAGAIFFVESDVVSAGNDGFSSSALGHRALVELLEEAGYDVVLSRGRSAEKVAGGALLVVLEPGDGYELDDEDRARFLEMLEAAPRALVALPKRWGSGVAERDGWLGSVELLDEEDPERVLEACGISGTVLRVEEGEPAWSSSSFFGTPALDETQLVAWSALEPWLTADEGVLIGRSEEETGREVFVLSDPDLFANHALDRGDNAALVLELFARIAPPGRALVFDETLHGFTVIERIWAALGRFPLVLVLIQALLVGGLLVWCGMRRFGAPVPDEGGLGLGKRVLVTNTADLLLHAGRSRTVLMRYLAQHRRRVGLAFHIAQDRPRAERRVELERIDRAKAPKVSLAQAEAAVRKATDGRPGSGQRTLRAARLVKRWSEEMMHGAR